MIQLLAIGLILSVEGVNTTIEELCDFIHESHHEKIGKIKDISAGAVTFAALGGYLVLCLLYINKILF
jgi:diacylglycerol kinase (ATP)